jgi:hypothetical protein
VAGFFVDTMVNLRLPLRRILPPLAAHTLNFSRMSVIHAVRLLCAKFGFNAVYLGASRISNFSVQMTSEKCAVFCYRKKKTSWHLHEICI